MHISCTEVALLFVTEDFSLGEGELKEASTVQNKTKGTHNHVDRTEDLQKTVKECSPLCSGLTQTVEAMCVLLSYS